MSNSTIYIYINENYKKEGDEFVEQHLNDITNVEIIYTSHPEDLGLICSECNTESCPSFCGQPVTLTDHTSIVPGSPIFAIETAIYDSICGTQRDNNMPFKSISDISKYCNKNVSAEVQWKAERNTDANVATDTVGNYAEVDKKSETVGPKTADVEFRSRSKKESHLKDKNQSEIEDQAISSDQPSTKKENLPSTTVPKKGLVLPPTIGKQTVTHAQSNCSEPTLSFTGPWSLACLTSMKDTNGQSHDVFISTCHNLKPGIHVNLTAEELKDKTAHAQVSYTFLTEVIEKGKKTLKVLGNTHCGIYDSRNSLDIILIPAHKDAIKLYKPLVKSSCKEKLYPSSIQLEKLEVQELQGSRVTKYGYASDWTYGTVVTADISFTTPDRKFAQLKQFIVRSQLGQNMQFAIRGDSGSIVLKSLRQQDEAEAYGLVSRSFKNMYCEDSGQKEDVVLCVGLQRCLGHMCRNIINYTTNINCCAPSMSSFDAHSVNEIREQPGISLGQGMSQHSGGDAGNQQYKKHVVLGTMSPKTQRRLSLIRKNRACCRRTGRLQVLSNILPELKGFDVIMESSTLQPERTKSVPNLAYHNERQITKSFK